MRLAPERHKQDESLGQASIERVGADRPADGLEPVPERLTVGWVMQQDRIAKITELTSGRGVDLRFVEEQPSERRGVDGRQARRLDDRRWTSPPRYRARWQVSPVGSAGPSDHLADPGYDRDRSFSRPERCIPVADDASDHPGSARQMRAPGAPGGPPRRTRGRSARSLSGPRPDPYRRRTRPPPDARRSPPRPARLPPDPDRVHRPDLPRGRHRPPAPEVAGPGAAVGSPVRVPPLFFSRPQPRS